jgi:nucleoside-diphosphate-sugar epimerase
MHTILGAGGVIGNGLALELATRKLPFRLVSRNPTSLPGATETIAANLTDPAQVLNAVAGSSVVYLVAGLKYDLRVWQRDWLRIIDNTIEACKRANARLIFFDNVYMYGKVDGPMTEETPFNPCSKKGEIRAELATRILEECNVGLLTALIARAADFYGPGATNSGPHVLIFDPLSKGKLPSTSITGSKPHSLTYTPDVARALLMLADRDSAWNQTWHLPTAPNPLTTDEFITLAAAEFDRSAKHKNLSRTRFRIGGLFDRTIYECIEMLYQSDSAYIFDSGKFAREFGFNATSYQQGIRTTAAAYKQPQSNI